MDACTEIPKLRDVNHAMGLKDFIRKKDWATLVIK
jgi:hypothetical protein